MHAEEISLCDQGLILLLCVINLCAFALMHSWCLWLLFLHWVRKYSPLRWPMLFRTQALANVVKARLASYGTSRGLHSGPPHLHASGDCSHASFWFMACKYVHVAVPLVQCVCEYCMYGYNTVGVYAIPFGMLRLSPWTMLVGLNLFSKCKRFKLARVFLITIHQLALYELGSVLYRAYRVCTAGGEVWPLDQFGVLQGPLGLFRW